MNEITSKDETAQSLINSEVNVNSIKINDNKNDNEIIREVDFLNKTLFFKFSCETKTLFNYFKS